MFSRLLKKNLFGSSVQWVVVEKTLLASLISSILSLVSLFLLSSLLEPWLLLKITPMMIFLGTLIVFTYSILMTFLMGLPLGRSFKEELLNIQEAHEAICRGRVNIRLTEGNYSEINQINKEFNSMASHTQRQVESLQRLVNENTLLLQNAEESASIGERKKIARELHDAISQQLFAISITLGAIGNLIDHKPEEAKKFFKKVEIMVHTAQQELRALIMHLRPVSLNGNPLTEGVAKLLQELDDKNNNISIRWDIENLYCLSPGIEDNVFRVVQESVSNVLRHAKATSLNVKVFSRNNVLSIFIEDNGIGFDNKKDRMSSYGILSMQERMGDIGGRLDIFSYPSKGTRVEIRVPI